MKSLIDFFHSIGASILSYNYIKYPQKDLKKIIFFTSHSYFLYDTINILNKHYLDILHHILSCFVLILFYLGYYEKILIELFFFS